MGFYPSDALVHDAQRHGIEVLPVCVHKSDALCRCELAVGSGQLAVRMGLGYVNGVRADDVAEIVAERERGGAFTSASDLAARCRAQRETLERLAWAGACDVLCDGSRRRALWELGVAVPGFSLDGGVQLALPLDVDSPELAELSAWERLLAGHGPTEGTPRGPPPARVRPPPPPQNGRRGGLPWDAPRAPA